MPYILKSKGTKQGLKAIIAAYGIPTSILRTQEYGGPKIQGEKDYEIKQRFTKALDFQGGQYLEAPWYHTGFGRTPDTIEMRFKTPYEADTVLAQKINSTDVHSFLNYGFNLAKEFNCKYWGLNLNNDKGSYREYSPFSLKSVLLGPFGGFIKGFDCRYDEKLPLKEDYDLSIQALNKYRKILRVNFVHYVCKQHTNEGGCASYRTINREKKQLLLLQKKWGKSIVKEDTTKKKNSNKVKTFDINPVIKVPIGGI